MTTQTQSSYALPSVAQATNNVNHAVLEASGLTTRFGQRLVLDNVNLQVMRGEIFAIVGGSGSGKSTLMRALTMLQPPDSGIVKLFGSDVSKLKGQALLPFRKKIGVMFQAGALFGDLTVLENVGLPLREHTNLPSSVIDQVAMLKISMAGLKPFSAALYPPALSGGMRKRVAVARAIALDPELLFLDEPGSGLDPVSADSMDDLILHLKQALGLTTVIITHDMLSLQRIADRVVLLADAKIAAQGTVDELILSKNPVVQQFFRGQRGRINGAGHRSNYER